MTALTTDPTAALQHALAFVRLPPLLDRTSGHPDLVVGVIDGPATLTHPALAEARVQVLPPATAPAIPTDPAKPAKPANPSVPADPPGCAVPDSAACRHGTFVLGMLAASRASPTPGLAPACSFVLRQVFCESAPGRTCPTVTPDDLADAITDTVDAGARIINLSLGIGAAVLTRSPTVDAAIDHAFHRGALVITAAGNHGLVGPAPLLTHPWLVQTAACDLTGRPLPSSNLGPTIGRSGLLAPGAAIDGLAPNGHQRLTGTSAAAPFVTGAAALLWSLRPNLTAPQLRAALLRPGVPRRSIVPPRLDAEASWRGVGGG